MIDAQRVDILYCVKQLQENMFNKDVVAKISSIIQDLREKVMVGRIIHYNIGIIVILDDFVKGNNPWMARCDLVQRNLANVLMPPTSRLCGRVPQALDCIGTRVWRPCVNGAVDDTIAPYTEDLDKFKGAAVDERPQRRVG